MGAGSVGWRPLLARELYDKAGITAVWERQPASSVRTLWSGLWGAVCTAAAGCWLGLQPLSAVQLVRTAVLGEVNGAR